MQPTVRLYREHRVHLFIPALSVMTIVTKRAIRIVPNQNYKVHNTLLDCSI